MEHWGDENEEHARNLDTANTKNILSKYSTYARKTGDEKEVRTRFTLTFDEMYRMQQATSAAPVGPIYLYEKTSTMLFIRACSTRRLCNGISIDTMLNKLQKPLDKVYHWTAMTALLPTYQCKTRAFTLYRNYLFSYKLCLAKDYFIKVSSIYDVNFVTKWYKRIIVQHATHRPNWFYVRPFKN